MSDSQGWRFSPSRLGIRAKFTLLFYLVCLGAVALVGFFGYRDAEQAYREKAMGLLAGYTQESAHKVGEFIELTRNDLAFFATNSEFLRHLYWHDLGEEENQLQGHGAVVGAWRDFVRGYDYLFKARFIDEGGREQIVIRRDPQSRQVRALGREEMQDQSKSDYFTQALKLAPGEVYVSEVGLSYEYGQFVRPVLPTLRLSRQVVGENGVYYGVAVLNLFAEGFFKYLREANERLPGARFYLLDADGNYLYHPNSNLALAHLLDGAEGFDDSFPEAFWAMGERERGMLHSAGHLVSFERICPRKGERKGCWTLVGTLSDLDAFAELRAFQYLFFGVVVLVMVAVYLTARIALDGLLRPMAALTLQVERLGRGEIRREPIQYRGRDEVGRMLASADRAIGNLELLARQADTIAKGDFSGSVPVLSEEDRLGQALNNMTRMLRDNRDDNERQLWRRDGIGQLNRNLSGERTPVELADRAVSFLGRYIEAAHGVFYIYREPHESLDLLGSYLFTERDRLLARLALGEATVGQAARERKPILLRQIRPGEQEVLTATQSGVPINTYTVPMLYEERLYGVLEFALLRPFNELERQFLDEAAAVAGTFLFSALQRERIRALLAESEEATRLAQEQSVRLQVANTQMEEQQQQLQQQTEELQQANAQMEEQQQQLQQQAEELMQTNSQMEEQQQQLQQQAHALTERNRALTQSQEELDQRARELEMASRYKSEFLANMSHELRTPLNSIILLSKMLAMNEEQTLGEEEMKRAGVIHRAGEELLRLINDILDLSKIEAGRMEVHTQPIRGSDLLNEMRELFEETARNRNLEFRLEDGWQGEFTSDHDKLSQILRNLLSNAFKFTHEGSVTLRLERLRDEHHPLRIQVSDTGIGVPREKQRLIFEAFQQADGSTSREYGGTGLGLSISQRLAQLLGGTIELASEPGKGSAFTILLPATAPSSAAAAPPLPRVLKPAAGSVPVESKSAAFGVISPPPQTPAQPPPKAALLDSEPPAEIHDDRNNLRSTDAAILVIDDDPDFGEIVATINRKRGYKTLIAQTAAEGLRMARVYRPKGILLDLGLPDRDGGELLHELKSTRELARIPVYIVSGRDKDEKLLRQGIVGYLQKPVDARQLADAEAAVVAHAGARWVLAVERGTLDGGRIPQLLPEEGLMVERTSDPAEAARWLAVNPCDLAILDLDDNPAEAAETCARLREVQPNLPILFYGRRPLTDEEEAQLRRYSDCIIQATAQSEQRMVENIERFLHQMPEPAKEQPFAQGGAAREKKLAGHAILVVDDDPRNLFVITSALEQQGAKVHSALNGKKALEFLAHNRVDLVFMDIMMPEMDGYQAIRLIRQNPAMKETPIVALTAKALRADREQARAAGADDYLAKPVDYEVLVNMAAVWCEGRR